LTVVPGQVVVGVSARLHPVKGVDVFLRACQSFRADPRYLFLIAGDGEERPKHEAFIQENGLTNCRLLGHVEDIYSFYDCLDINVLASRTESFSYSLLEGGAMKKATVATAVGGIPEMIEDGVSGRLFTSLQPAAIANAIRATTGAELARFAANAQARFHATYTATAMASRMTALYRDVISNREQPAAR